MRTAHTIGVSFSFFVSFKAAFTFGKKGLLNSKGGSRERKTRRYRLYEQLFAGNRVNVTEYAFIGLTIYCKAGMNDFIFFCSILQGQLWLFKCQCHPWIRKYLLKIVHIQLVLKFSYTHCIQYLIITGIQCLFNAERIFYLNDVKTAADVATLCI